MSTVPLPSRTRSIRKPSVGVEQRSRPNGLNAEAAPDASGARNRNADTTDTARRANHSPSRLPTRPPSSGSSATTSRLTRAASLSQRTASSGTRPGSSDGSMRPPPRPTSTRAPLSSDNHKPSVSRPSLPSDNHKPSISRPPLTSDNYKVSTRSISRTPAESTSSVHRQPSTRHTRATSTSSVSTSIKPPATRHARTASITQLGASTVLRPPSETKQAPNPALHRPAFSTLQQHYSPAKSLAPKPTTASLLAPPSPSKLSSNVAISAETARLQAELLQLHLLHRDAASVQKQWRESAKTSLGEKFEVLVRKHEGLVGVEEAQHDRVNALALKSWVESGVPGWGLEEKIQILDEVITELWSMGEAGGKYARIVRKFEKWMYGVMDIHQARQKGQLLGDEDVMFIEEIDGPWRDECRAQSRKLEGWKDKLVSLGDVEGKGSLATVVEGCRAMVRGMMEELDIMKKIEMDIMRNEQQWVKAMIDEPEEEEQGPVAGAIWRRF